MAHHPKLSRESGHLDLQSELAKASKLKKRDAYMGVVVKKRKVGGRGLYIVQCVAIFDPLTSRSGMSVSTAGGWCVARNLCLVKNYQMFSFKH